MNLNDVSHLRERVINSMDVKGTPLTLGELGDISQALTNLINLQIHYEVDVTKNLAKRED